MEREEIMSIPNTSEMAVDAKVHEANIDKVTPGQMARIIVDAMPDQAFYGQVLKISPLPDPAAFMANPDLKVYTTELSLEGSTMLRPGMSAKVEIVIAQLKEVLAFPFSAFPTAPAKNLLCHGRRPRGTRSKSGPYGLNVQIIEGLMKAIKCF
jgi:multidrug efflux pump subunit AcrA (membrane-fusion protein)